MILFKTPELADQLDKCDPRLSVILLAVSIYLARQNPARPLTVTCLLRTDAEQAAIVATAKKLGRQEPSTSPHQFGRAADVSVLGWPPELIPNVVNFINTRYPYHGNAAYHSALAHDVGQGNHIHIQVAGPVLAWEKMK